MAITQGICNSFKEELLDGIHNFNAGGDTFKIALFTSAATISPTTTTQYPAGSEVSGAGYSTGGINLTTQSTTLSSGTAFVDFADAQWSGATFTARGAMIYNSSKANRAVMILDFGSDKVAAASNFTVQFPSADATNAILRLT